MIAEIFTIIAPVIVCAGIGFSWAKLRVPYETQFVTRLVTNVGFPCLIFVSLVTSDLDADALGTMGLTAILSVAVFAAISLAIFKLANIERRVFLPAMMFANTGNMGLPLCLFAFGEPGLALGIAYFTVNGIIGFALIPAIASGNLNPKGVLKIPLIWASVAALTVKFGGVPIPEWTMKTLTLIGGFPIPLMLITLGVSLTQLQASGLGRAFLLSVLRLVMGFAVGWGIGEVMGLDPIAKGVLIIECAMPVAVFNFLFAQVYNTRPGEVAGTVLISTLLSFATLPLLMWFVLPGS